MDQPESIKEMLPKNLRFFNIFQASLFLFFLQKKFILRDEFDFIYEYSL